MEYGVHLPLIDFSGKGFSLAELRAYAKRASDLGYTFLCANDHLLFSRPWLDGPTALAAVLEVSGAMTLATTVSIPVVRGPMVTAKTLGAIDLLSGGRLVVGVGPGSSERDYEAAGVPFEERWKRFKEIIEVLRALWTPQSEGFEGSFYSTDGIRLEPYPAQRPAPPIWVASWGSKAGLRRVARHGDGWLASGYNTTPGRFAESLAYLSEQLSLVGKQSESFPNSIATLWMYVTEDRSKAEEILSTVLRPTVNRPLEELRERLPIGSPEMCAEKLTAYAAAGAQRVFLWPLDDELEQLDLFYERVVPLIEDSSKSITTKEC
jgi:alkanesulfonate monooxygenase SsuD/methylene tetrahydromethanopterin reductase-like flavin-dependent oxidoreductase (luciferase family)